MFLLVNGGKLQRMNEIGIQSVNSPLGQLVLRFEFARSAREHLNKLQIRGYLFPGSLCNPFQVA
jgi:hypothetical protein